MPASLRNIALFFEAIAFTIIVPGTVAVWIPREILARSGRGFPEVWGVAQFAAVPLLLVGGAIYLRCVWEFAARGRGIPLPVDHPKRLVVTGLYRYVRNPMYLGVLLFLLGEVLLFQSRTLLLYTLGWLAVVHLFVVLYEEPTLRHKFGASYDRYRAAVRRWIPGRRYGDAAQ